MASVKLTAMYTFCAHPSLHDNMGSFLDHCFYVIGNGYEWKNGQLICDNITEKNWKQKAKKYRDEFNAWSKEYIKKHNKEFKEFIDAGLTKKVKFDSNKFPTQKELRLLLNDFNLSSLYSICEYSRITYIPDNVKQDWLLAAIRLCEETLVATPESIIERIKKRFPDHSIDSKHYIKTLKDNQKIIKKLLPQIKERFKDRL